MNADRPKLGSSIIANAIMVRKGYWNHKDHFDREWNRQEEYIQGVYIGYRTVADGDVEYDEDTGRYFIPRRHHELWLVVCDPRNSPVHVKPEDCIWEK